MEMTDYLTHPLVQWFLNPFAADGWNVTAWFTWIFILGIVAGVIYEWRKG